jgi:hypothetical protein
VNAAYPAMLEAQGWQVVGVLDGAFGWYLGKLGVQYDSSRRIYCLSSYEKYSKFV